MKQKFPQQQWKIGTFWDAAALNIIRISLIKKKTASSMSDINLKWIKTHCSLSLTMDDWYLGCLSWWMCIPNTCSILGKVQDFYHSHLSPDPSCISLRCTVNDKLPTEDGHLHEQTSGLFPWCMVHVWPNTDLWSAIFHKQTIRLSWEYQIDVSVHGTKDPGRRT